MSYTDGDRAPSPQNQSRAIHTMATNDQPETADARLKDYLAIARFDHGTKHIFVVPGIILAYMLRGVRTEALVQSLIFGFLSVVCIGSANYVINEFLDREFDKHHPTKSGRSAVQRRMSGTIVAVEWATFVLCGLACAALANKLVLMVACVFALQGIVYNVSPLRTKNVAYLDVLSESINNPIRLMVGWAIVDPTSLPPGSLILSYWLGGAFLMAAKRLSEYCEITAAHGTALLVRYRASFANYSEVSLTASCISYSLLSVTFLSIFLVKYRIEYLLLMPFVVALFTYYFAMSTHAGSAAQRPERLFREFRLMAMMVALVVAFLFTSFVDIPVLATLSGQHFITLE